MKSETVLYLILFPTVSNIFLLNQMNKQIKGKFQVLYIYYYCGPQQKFLQ